MTENRFLKIDGFEIIQDEFKPEENKYYEGIFAQGNGYFHVRGSCEEGLEAAPQDEIYTRTMKSVTTEIQRHPLSKQGTFLPLIMGKHPFLEEVIINLPYFMEVQITADGERLDMMSSRIRDCRRVLNMKNGELKRSFTWITAGGNEIRAEFSRFASMKEKHLFVQKIKLDPQKGNPRIKIISGIDGSVTTNGYRHFTECCPFVVNGTEGITVKTDAGESVSIMSRNRLSGMNVEQYSENRTESEVSVQYEGMLEESTELLKYSAIGCSRDRCADHAKAIEQCLEQVDGISYEELLSASSEIWEKRWQDSDIKITGCRKLQDGLRFSIYHLLRCAVKEEDRIQICAKGFAGEAYYGRYFWDSEMYLLPFYLYTDPVSAQSLAGYRYHTLGGARENARRYHCRGARYPWQSGLTGAEQCSLWEYADNEIHITADVAFGIVHYVRSSGDEKFLFDKGMEVLLETAAFWTDRADRGRDGRYHLINVMGPDEYSPMTRDNGFTNYMVKYSLETALEMLEFVKDRRPERYTELLDLTGVSKGDLEKFREIAESLPIPYDEKRDLYLQSADFEDYAEIDMESLWEDKRRAFGHYAPQEKIYRSRCIKQADTIALMSLFPEEFTDHQLETAYEYYKPMTTHDSSLSPAVHALAANRLGRDKETEDFLDRTLSVDMELARRGAEDGIHIANCGALWQMAVQGFLGMIPGYQSDELRFSPKMPSFIESMEVPVKWKGKKYRIVAAGNRVSVRKEPAEVKGFLFDLDGVLTDTAEYHFLAWKQLSDELGLRFDRNINERLKGVSRERSFEIILEENQAEERFTQMEKTEYVKRKNEYYQDLIRQITPKDILPGVSGFLREAKERGILLAVASASKNARTVLDGLEITHMFDYIADAAKIRHTKPDPEVFTDCMEHLGLQPWECIGFEDADAGIRAIQAAHITAVGIGKGTVKSGPDIFLQSTSELSIANIEKLVEEK